MPDQQGMERNKQLALARAMQALSAGPNPDALRTVYAIDPQLGMQVENQLYQRNALAALQGNSLVRNAPKGRMDDAYAPWDGVYRPEAYDPLMSDGVYRQSPDYRKQLLQRWQDEQAGIHRALPDA